MRRNIYIVLFLTFYTITAGRLVAGSLYDILPEGMTIEEREMLAETQYVYRYDKTGDGISFAPSVPFADGLERDFEELAPQYLIEVLSVIPYEGYLAWDDYMLTAYNQFRSVSTISGVLYTSSHDGEEKELFSDVYRVESNKERQPLPDSLVESIPEEDSFVVHMKEANMGRGFYDFDYRYDGSEISLTITNISTMRMFFKVLEPGGLEFRFIFVPADEGVLVYASCATHLENLNLVKKALTPWGYFHNRIKILYGWLYRGLLGEGAWPPIP